MTSSTVSVVGDSIHRLCSSRLTRPMAHHKFNFGNFLSKVEHEVEQQIEQAAEAQLNSQNSYAYPQAQAPAPAPAPAGQPPTHPAVMPPTWEQHAQTVPPDAPLPQEPAYSGPPIGSGRHKALLIGINYVGSRNELRGCWNDVENMRNYIQTNCGYPANNIRVMRDAPGEEVPNGQNIRLGMHWLVDGAEPGDSLFLHYSGHGTQVAENGSQEDAIVPVDFRDLGVIIADEIHSLIVKDLKQGVRLTVVFDCCHSGTAMDLPYNEVARKDLPDPPHVRQANIRRKAQALHSLNQIFMAGIIAAQKAHHQQRGTTHRSVLGSLLEVGESILAASFIPPTPEDREKKNRTNDGSSSWAQIVLYSGCKDTETSADTSYAGQAQGAMTHAMLESIQEANNNISWLQLLYNVRAKIKQFQTPQISFNRPMFNLDARAEF